MKPIKRKVTIHLSTPLRIGGELGTDLNIAYILRDSNGKAYYPGTAFKGKVRHWALQLQQGSCSFPEPCECAVCTLFGGEGNARGSLFFSDFTADASQTDFRIGIAIDRYRRVSEDEKLFTTEAAVIPKLEGWITGNADDDEVKLLESSVKLINQIGGNVSRGFGWVDSIEIENALEPVPNPATEADTNFKKDTVSLVRVSLIPTSPLLIGTHTTQSNFRDTRHSIPGAVLRAALARAICERDGTHEASIEGILTDVPKGGGMFANLRQSFKDLRISALNPVRPDTEERREPYPLTARECKFRCGCDQVDILATLINCGKEECPECHKRLEKVTPYRCKTVTSTHSEMDRWRGVAKDGRLFTVRAIAAESDTFCGTISGTIHLEKLLLLAAETLRVGAKLTAGFGGCRVTFESVTDELDRKSKKDELKQRIIDFNVLIDKNDIFVPITLLSDAIVDLKEPPNGDYIQEYAKLFESFEHFALDRVIGKSSVWRGFDTSKRGGTLEKEARFLLQAGSVFVARVDNLDDDTMEFLMGIERNGIGEEAATKDGYGAVRVAHRYHIDSALSIKRRISL